MNAFNQTYEAIKRRAKILSWYLRPNQIIAKIKGRMLVLTLEESLSIINQKATRKIVGSLVGGIDNKAVDLIKEYAWKFSTSSKIIKDYAEFTANNHGPIWTACKASALPHSMEVIKQAFKDYIEFLVEMDLLTNKVKDKLIQGYSDLGRFLSDNDADHMLRASQERDRAMEIDKNDPLRKKKITEKQLEESSDIYKWLEKMDKNSTPLRSEITNYIDLVLLVKKPTLLRFLKKTIKEYAASMITIILFVGLIVWGIKDYYGVEEVGHFFEKSEYRAIYYINLYKTRDDTVSNRVRGRIGVTSTKTIYLNEIYFSKNRSVLLGDCVLSVGEKEYCIDDSGNNWYIELDKKVNECTVKEVASNEDRNVYTIDVDCKE